MWLRRLVCVYPGRKPRRQFSRDRAQMTIDDHRYSGWLDYLDLRVMNRFGLRYNLICLVIHVYDKIIWITFGCHSGGPPKFRSIPTFTEAF